MSTRPAPKDTEWLKMRNVDQPDKRVIGGCLAIIIVLGLLWVCLIGTVWTVVEIVRP